jgi:hypothetical protein
VSVSAPSRKPGDPVPRGRMRGDGEAQRLSRHDGLRFHPKAAVPILALPGDTPDNPGVAAGYDKRRAIAFVSEDSGDPTIGEDGLWTLGLFTVFVEAGHSDGGIDHGPARVPAEEAIAWARERAARVVVRVEDSWQSSFYSAGELQALDDNGTPLAAWPDGGLDLKPRRSPGWEHVDRTEADEPIDWDIVVSWDSIDGIPGGVAKELRNKLERNHSLRDVVVKVHRTRPARGPAVVIGLDPRLRVRLCLKARTLKSAKASAVDACQHSLHAVLRSLGETPPRDFQHWSAEAYPTGSHAARANAPTW